MTDYSIIIVWGSIYGISCSSFLYKFGCHLVHKYLKLQYPFGGFFFPWIIMQYPSLSVWINFGLKSNLSDTKTDPPTCFLVNLFGRFIYFYTLEWCLFLKVKGLSQNHQKYGPISWSNLLDHVLLLGKSRPLMLRYYEKCLLIAVILLSSCRISSVLICYSLIYYLCPLRCS